MSDVVTEAVAALNAKMGGAGFDGTAKFTIEDEGSIIIDGNGTRQRRRLRRHIDRLNRSVQSYPRR